MWSEILFVLSRLLHVSLAMVWAVGCRRKNRRASKPGTSTPSTQVPPTPAHKAVPPPNVPVSKPRQNDSTLKEVESLKPRQEKRMRTGLWWVGRRTQ